MPARIFRKDEVDMSMLEKYIDELELYVCKNKLEDSSFNIFLKDPVRTFYNRKTKQIKGSKVKPREFYNSRFFQCEVCGKLYHNFLREKHHIVFKSENGSNKNFNKFYTCCNCHTFLHHVFRLNDKCYNFYVLADELKEVIASYVCSLHQSNSEEYYEKMYKIFKLFGFTHQ